MNTHAYLRAYMAGIVVPTIGLLLGLTAFIIFRLILQFPVPIERAIAFPMALVPNLWGLWNMVYVRMRQRGPWNIGLHGGVLPLILGPLGFTVGRALGVLETHARGLVYFGDINFDYAFLVFGAGVGLVAYYLFWKYVVNFFNEVLGIA